MFSRPPFPMTGMLVTSVILSSAVASESMNQKNNDAQLATEFIGGKAIIDEGIRGLEIKPQSIQSMMDEVRETGSLEIDDFPLPDGSTVSLKLHEANPFAPGARFIRQSSTDPSTARVESAATPEDALILTGHVADDEDSFAMLALSDKGSFGLIQSAKGRAIISSGKLGANLEPVIYNPETALGGILNMSDWVCEVESGHLDNDAIVGNHPAQGGVAGAACKVVKIAIEYDYEFWDDAMGSDAWVALFYTAALVASLDEIFSRDVGIGIELSNIRVWDEPEDPWTGANTLTQLTELREWYTENGDDVERDVVIFCSSRGLGGGRAYVSGLCNGWGYSVCGNMNGSFPYPLAEYDAGNWDIIVVAHELGHNLGTWHSHDYCPPIDKCAPAGWFGSCQEEQVCSKGTLMSYCHLCDGGKANIQLRFHPTVAQTIADYVAGSDCVNDGAPTVDAYSDSAETLMNTAVTIDALHNDRATCSDVSLDSFDEMTTAGGSVRRSVGTGSFGRDELIYQPPAGFIGEDSFNYVASNDFAMLDPGPIGVTVVPQVEAEDLLIIDPAQNIVQRFDAQSCAFLGTLVPPDEGGLDLPQAACLGPGGDLLVASFKNDYVLRYDPNSGESNGVFYGGDLIDGPNDLPFDFDSVYVSAKNAQQVVVVKASGAVGFVYPVGDNVNDILLEEERDRLLVAFGSGGFVGGVQIWSTEAHEMTDSFATPELEHTTAVCRISGGDLLVGDWAGGAIARYDGTTFAFEGWFLSAESSAALNINNPNRIEWGPNDLVHVTSSSGLHRFKTSGDYFDTPESTNDPLLNFPRGLFFRLDDTVPGDLDGDGDVDGADLAILLGNWGGTGTGDLNGDGNVDGADLAILLGNWG